MRVEQKRTSHTASKPALLYEAVALIFVFVTFVALSLVPNLTFPAGCRSHPLAFHPAPRAAVRPLCRAAVASAGVDRGHGDHDHAHDGAAAAAQL